MRKKFIIIGIFAIGLFFSGSFNVYARECTWGLQAPQIPQGYAENKGNVVNLKTTASACKGVNTAVYFSKFGSLPNWYTPSSGTIVHGYLMEDDPPAYEPDERVKYYIGFFTGRVLTDFQLNKTITPGNIDSEGDQTCELYMNFSISGTTGGTPIPQGLFYYGICMN